MFGNFQPKLTRLFISANLKDTKITRKSIFHVITYIFQL